MIQFIPNESTGVKDVKCLHWMAQLDFAIICLTVALLLEFAITAWSINYVTIWCKATTLIISVTRRVWRFLFSRSMRDFGLYVKKMVLKLTQWYEHMKNVLIQARPQKITMQNFYFSLHQQQQLNVRNRGRNHCRKQWSNHRWLILQKGVKTNHVSLLNA